MAFPLHSGEIIYTPVLTYDGVSVFDSSVFMFIEYTTSWIRVYIFPDNEFKSSWLDSDGKIWLDFKSGYTEKYISSIYSFTKGTWGSWSSGYTSTFKYTLTDNNFWFLNAPSGATLPSGGPPEIYLYTVPLPRPPFILSDLDPILNSFTDQITVQLVVTVLAAAAGVSVGLVFLWWGARKVTVALMKAFKKGKIRI